MKSNLLKLFITLFSVLSLDIYSQSLGNNSCATAVSVPTTGICVTGNNTTANATGDGPASCYTVENGIWFKFVAPASGIANITTDDAATNFDSQLTLFSGTCGALSELDCDDDGGTGNTALIQATCLIPGQTYFVMMDGYAGDIGNFCIKITTVATPLNDNCSCATTIPLNGTCLNNQTTVGGNDSWTGIVGCQSGDGHSDVWYTFVADSSSVTFTVTSGTMGGNVEMILAKANNCTSTFSTNGTYCAPSIASNTFLNLTVGATYYLTVSSSGAVGTFTICGLSSTPPPIPGQNCTTAANLCSDASFAQAVSNAGFGIQEVSPANSCWGSGGERQSRWYKFTVGATGTLGFEIKPNVNTDDYDWALWDITTAGCPSSVSATPNAIACNWFGTTTSLTDVEGSTGLSTYTTAADICAFQSGATDQGNPGCLPYSFLNEQTSTWGPISVQAGHTYAILIDNFSTTNNGFTFDFGGTAHIGPVADFVTLKSCTTASLISAPSASNTAYNWNYGDGITSTTSYSVAHTYTAPGTYSLSLGVTDALGCTAAFNDVLNIGNPSLAISPTETICAGGTATLLATAIPNNPQLTFSNNTAASIPDNNTTGISSTVTVSGISPTTISTNQMVKVCLNITHTWDSDLDIVLTCPSGNTVILTSDNGVDGNNYSNTCFTGLIATDVAAGIAPAVAPFNAGSGYYSPESGFTGLNSCNINGNWVLNIKDDEAGDTGILNNWSMTFNSTSNSVTYSWTPSGTLSSATSSSPTASPTTTTIYTVTATDLQGCTVTGTTQVVVNPLPTPTISSTNTLCLGSSLTFTGSGATTYTWSSGAGGGLSTFTGSPVSATPTSAGSITYSLAVTDANSCTNMVVKTITVSPIPTANAGSNATLTCSNSTVTLSGSGGGNYVWSGPGIVSGGSTATPGVNAPGTYSLVVTNTTSCSSPIATVSVSQNTVAPTLTVSANQTITCNSPSVSISGAATPSTSTPVWTGGVASGANSYTAVASSANVYTLTVTNPANGCSAFGTVTVSPNAGSPSLSPAAVSNSITCSLATAQVTLNSTPAGNTYSWSGPGITSGAATSVMTASVGGTYSVVVTNTASSCTSSITVNVPTNTTVPTPTATTNGTLTCNTSSLTVPLSVSPSSGLTYTWTGTGITAGGSTATPTVNLPGTFSVTVTNTVNGCSNSTTTAVIQNTVAPSVTGAATSSLNCTTSTVNVSATTTVTPVIYNWSGTGITSATNISTITVNQGGNYSYTVTNTANSCTTTNTLTVIQNTISPAVTGATSGSLNCTVLSVNASATTTTTAVSYSWTGTGITSATNISTITVNQGGTFNYTVTNTSNNCTTTNSVSVSQNTVMPLLSTSTSGSLTCTTTTASINISTTASPVSYNWSGTGITSATTGSLITVNQPGNFNYTVTNTFNNCSVTGTEVVDQNTITPSVTASNTGSLNCTVSSIDIVATTTVTPVTYVWSGTGITAGAGTPTISVNQGGTFNYTVTNTDNGCKTIGSQAITQNTIAPNVTASNTGSLNCTTTTVNVSATTTVTPVSYNWTGTGITAGSTTGTISVNQPGTYNYTVTNTSNNCTATGSQTITQNITAPALTMPASQTITCAAPTVTMIASANPSTCTPVWTGGVASGVNSYTATASSANIYTLTVTNPFNGCVNSGTTQVSPSAGFPSVTTSVTNSLSCTVTSAQVVATTTASPVTYNWSGPGITSGATTASASVNAPGQYTVIVTNTLSLCSSTLTIAVIQNTIAPNVTGATSGTLTCTTLTVNASATTTTTPVSYVWSGTGITAGSGTGTITVNQPGNFNYTVTNTSNGCFTTGTQTVIQNTIAPTVTGATSGTLTCTTLTVNASVTTTTTPVTYTWSGTGITSAANISTITVNQPGTFNYTVTNTTNGCITSGSQTIIQNTVSPTVTAANTGSLNCTTTTVNVTASTTVTPVSYNWSGPGITSGTGTGTISVNSGGTYNYTVTNTDNNCTTIGSQAILQNTVSPSVTGANTGSLNCVITSVNASATTTTTPVTYNWSGSGITAGAGTGTISVNVGGTYNYTVTNTANNCSTTGSQAITQNTTAPTSTATTSGSITCVTNTINLNSSLAGMNYTWTAPGGSSILSGSSLQNAVGQGLGNYTLTVLNTANSCTFQTSVAAIQNTTTPTSVDAGPNQTLVCITPTVSLNGSAAPASATANWIGGVSSPNTFTTSTGAAGVYTLQAIEPTTGCFIMDTVRVIQSVNSPTVTSNPVTNSITCTNSVVTIGISVSSPDPVTISWPTGTGISGPTNTVTTTATLTGVYQVTVTNTFNSCISINSINVPINITPVTVSISPASSITCSSPTQTLSVLPVGSNYTYTWSGTGITSGGTTSNPVVNNGGDFDVIVTNTVNGCAGTSTVNVPMDISTPTVNISTASYTTTCASPNASLSITSTPTANVTYSWTAPSGGSLDNYTISNPVTSGSGIFTVVVTNTVNGCSSSLTQNTVEIIPDAAIPNISLSSNSVAITCSDPTPSVSISTTATPVSYSWSPTSGIVAGTETSATPSFSLNGTYSVVVTNTASGCATDITTNVVTVSLDNTEPVISLSSATNDGTITCTNTFVIVTPTITPNSNLSYTWSPSAGISTPVNQSSATFTAAGVYSLVVTNTLTGCVNTSTNAANTFTVIEDNVIPTFTLGTASSVTTTCASPNATLSASSNLDPNTIYTWLTPSSTTLTGSPINVSTAGIYSVIVTNTLNGCSNSSAASQNTVEVVTGTGIPSVSMSANSISITCSNPTPSVSISTTSTPVSYSWSPSAGILSGTETTAAPTFTAAGSYSVVVTNTVSGCASSINSNVVTVTEDNFAPTITLSSATNDGTITCLNPSVTITPTITTSGALADLTYTWSPSGVTSTSINDATFTSSGIYTLVITNTLTGCVTSSTNTVNTFTVYGGTTIPTATITAVSTNSTIGCSGTGSFVTLSSSATATNVINTWLPGNIPGLQFNVTAQGVYSLVTTDAITGCSDTTDFTVTGNLTPPQGVDAGTSANISCGNTSTTLSGVSTTTNVSYSWSGPSSTSIISDGTTPNPVVAETGTYTLTVTDVSTGCQSTATVSVTQANVTASFTANPTAGTSPLTVNFTDSSVGATNWNWNFGDSNTSPLQNPTNVYTSGSYTVTLTASSGSCTSTATVVIVVEDGLTMEIPNVFTPNGDGANDVFSIKSTGVKEISLQIFNRWGEKLYEFSGPKASWDGLAPNGLEVPEGTYFFFVKATGFDDAEVEKHGTVNLFR